MTVTVRPRVLLVDDDPRILAGLRRQLHQHYEVATAAGGEQGLEQLRAGGPFAAVISDMRMPGMDGAAFLARVRVDCPRAARLLLTGQADLTAAVRAINDGQVFRFLDKPCPPQVLDRALREAVARFETACDQDRLLAAALTDRRVLAGRDAGAVPDEIRLCYRPIVEFAQERVTAVEAVLCGSGGGQLALLPAPTGALHTWLTAAACQEVASWATITTGRPIDLHVTLPAGRLLDPQVGDDLARSLVLSGLEPDRVVLVVADAAAATQQPGRDFLRAVTGRGVRLAVTCPAADPAPLRLADVLPVSIVKVRDIQAGGSPIIAAAHGRGLTVAADGVDTAADDHRARAAGCQTGQGACYGGPTDPSRLLADLADIRLG